MNPKTNKIRKMIFAALCMALITAITRMTGIPVPIISGAYIHAGDGMIYAAAWLLGGWWGALAAGIGSMLSDLLMSYAQYALATLIIKGIMGLIAGWLFLRMKDKLIHHVWITLLGGAVMIVGYGIFETMTFGLSKALLSALPNLLQAGAGTLVGVLFIQALLHVPSIREVRKG